MSAYARGIDISDNNGEFDFGAYPGIDFAFFKGAELTAAGWHYDAQFARNMTVSAGHYGRSFARFAYLFAHPGEQVAVQAQTLVTVARDHGLEPGDHLMMDLEVTDGLAAAEVARWAAGFCHEVNRLAPGHRCVAYTFPAFAEQGNCAGLWPWRLYLADWGAAEPTVPEPWASAPRKDLATWHFWQFAAGKDGSPDLDVFHGDKAALLDFCRMPKDRR